MAELNYKRTIDCKKCAGHGTIWIKKQLKYKRVFQLHQEAIDLMDKKRFMDYCRKMIASEWKEGDPYELEPHLIVIKRGAFSPEPEQFYETEETPIEIDCPKCDGY